MNEKMFQHNLPEARKCGERATVDELQAMFNQGDESAARDLLERAISQVGGAITDIQSAVHREVPDPESPWHEPFRALEEEYKALLELARQRAPDLLDESE